jgi:hypothetical protein
MIAMVSARCSMGSPLVVPTSRTSASKAFARATFHSAGIVEARAGHQSFDDHDIVPGNHRFGGRDDQFQQVFRGGLAEQVLDVADWDRLGRVQRRRQPDRPVDRVGR